MHPITPQHHVDQEAQTRRRFAQLGLWLVVVGGMFAFLLQNATAQTTDSITASVRNRDTLRIDSTIHLPEPGGYGSVDVEITCAGGGPSQADRDLTVVFFLQGFGYPNGTSKTAVQKVVRFPEGSTSVKSVIPVLLSGSNQFDIGVFEDGRNIEAKGLFARTSSKGQPYLEVDTSGISLGSITTGVEFAGSQYATKMQHLQSQLRIGESAGSSKVKHQSVSISEASTDWRFYTSRSIWFVSAETLAEMQTSRPGVAGALVDYVASGGELAVYSIPAGLSAREATEAMFGQSASRFTWTPVKSPKSSWWRRSQYEEVNRLQAAGDLPADDYGSYDEYGLYGGFDGYDGYDGYGYGEEVPQFQKVVRSDGSVVIVLGDGTKHVVQSAGADESNLNSGEQLVTDVAGIMHDAAILGETWYAAKVAPHMHLMYDIERVVCFPDEREYVTLVMADLLGKTHELRTDLFRALEREKVATAAFHGGQLITLDGDPSEMPIKLLRQALEGDQQWGSWYSKLDPYEDSTWFFRNLIAAVGKPPVWMFCILVSLFGVVVGPGLLLLTGRIKRRSLLLFFVPAVSGFAVIGILVYGVLHEGFATHLKVTSVQWLDLGSGDGFAWSRQNYFSGLPKRDGLVFREDTYVRQVLTGEDLSNVEDVRDRLQATIDLTDQQRWTGWLKSRTQQQMLVGHRLRNVTLPISITRKSSAKISIQNTTDEVVPIAVLRDESGYYFAIQIPAGGMLELNAQPFEDIQSVLSRTAAEIKPSAPPELAGGSGSLLNFGPGNGYWFDETESGDVIDSAYRQFMSDQLEIPIGGFSIFTTQSDAIELPLEGEMDTSLHLIVGEGNW